jgi:hypothetical protein
MIYVESALGRGTLVRVELPARAPEMNRPEPASSPWTNPPGVGETIVRQQRDPSAP